jgi:pilus assembly protein CpaC
MSPLSAFASLQRARRRAGSALALVAAVSFVIETPMALAQTQPSDTLTNSPVPEKAKPKPKKTVSRHTATDNLSDDLNRRESQRAAQVVQQMNGSASASSTAVAVPTASPTPLASGSVTAASPPIASLPPTVPAIPERAPVVTASLTPTVGGATPSAPAPIQQVPVQQAPAQQAPLQQAQAQPPAQAPAPVPIRPVQPAPAQATPAAPPPPSVTGAPSRSFAQSQVVPTQQPTLSLEINKGTALKLPGPAATVFVAAPDIADVQVKSPGMIYVFAKKAGDTVLYAVDDQDRVLLNTIVHVTSPIGRMKASLDAIHPGNGVNFDNQGETIVLTGTVRSALIAEDARRLALQNVNGNATKVISNIRIDAPTQVQLRVKIAEVKRDALKRVGINWQNVANIALFGAGATTGFATSTFQAIGGISSAAAGVQTSGGLSGMIDLLATQSQATILAEPNLVAMSGETASFLAGGEIPVITPQAGLTGSTIAVTYKQVGVSLAFTPTIVGDRINLKVAPEVSQLSATGSINVPLTATSTVTIPALDTRRAATTVELGSGQSFAIAGLLQRTGEQDVKKVPWLGDVPVLGSLFKSDAYQRSETELVIIVTPYFVEPTSQQLRTPFSDRVPPSDADRLLLQRMDHPTPPATMAVSGGGRQAAGPTAGFKLE